MTFKKNFCPSPWFHMRINNSGSYEYCRWKNTPESKDRINFEYNIKSQDPQDFFKNTMSQVRTELLNGQAYPGCCDCYAMENYNKVSGRQRQLLKVGVMEDCFEKSLASSPFVSSFDYSYQNNGTTERSVTDWQIDLGNYCNGACIFCNPESSSRLAQEYLSLNLIDQLPPNSWCNDPVLLQKFIDHLLSTADLKYLHFIGGETVITPGFKKILEALVNSGQSKTITIGFTTNLLAWSESTNDLLAQFNSVNLGLSIETLTPVNDYVRWPCNHTQTLSTLDRWVELGKKHNWLTQLRITPTCLTIKDLWTVYDYAWQHNLAVESCNFLFRPECLRINVLPMGMLDQAKLSLSSWIDQHRIKLDNKIINTRDPNRAQEQILQDALSYLNFINSTTDESFRLPDLVTYLKLLEGNRKNTILDYLPEYEELLRSAGY